jgi:hypothetical protein
LLAHPLLESLADAGLGSTGELIGAKRRITDLDLGAAARAVGSAGEITELAIDETQDALHCAVGEILGPLFVLGPPLFTLLFS